MRAITPQDTGHPANPAHDHLAKVAADLRRAAAERQASANEKKASAHNHSAEADTNRVRVAELVAAEQTLTAKIAEHSQQLSDVRSQLDTERAEQQRHTREAALFTEAANEDLRVADENIRLADGVVEAITKSRTDEVKDAAAKALATAAISAPAARAPAGPWRMYRGVTYDLRLTYRDQHHNDWAWSQEWGRDEWGDVPLMNSRTRKRVPLGEVLAGTLNFDPVDPAPHPNGTGPARPDDEDIDWAQIAAKLVGSWVDVTTADAEAYGYLDGIDDGVATLTAPIGTTVSQHKVTDITHIGLAPAPVDGHRPDEQTGDGL